MAIDQSLMKLFVSLCKEDSDKRILELLAVGLDDKKVIEELLRADKGESHAKI